MIAKVCKNGSNPGRLLHYLGHDRRAGAQLLDTNLLGSDRRVWASQLEDLTLTHRPNKKRLVKHFVLSYDRGEHRSEGEMREAARYFLDRMGYSDSPFVVYLHTDTGIDHLHLVTTPTTWSGMAVRESHDRWRSVRIAREIEDRWGLHRVASPESAQFSSASQGEIKAAKRSGKPSARATFQYEVAQAARRSKTLVAFVEALYERGIKTRVLLDEDGRLKGISFAAGEVAFKGSQLGRAFRAGRILSMYGLAYDPGKDRAALIEATSRKASGRSWWNFFSSAPDEPTLEVALRGEATLRAKEEKRATAQGLTSTARRAGIAEDDVASDLGLVRAKADVQTRDLRSVSRPDAPFLLPEGLYRVCRLTRYVHPDRETGADRWHESYDPEWRRPQELAARIWEEERVSTASRLVVESQPTDQERMIGFRGLHRDQLAALRADGWEPAVLVRIGKEYDLWLRVSGKLAVEEWSALSRELRERYRLGREEEARDAIRLPGAVIDVAGRPRQVELVETRDGVAPAWQRWQAEMRYHQNTMPLEILLPDSIRPLRSPIAWAEPLLKAERPRISEGNPLAFLQERVDEVRRSVAREASTGLKELSSSELRELLKVINSQAIEGALIRKAATFQSASSWEALLPAELELERRLSAARTVFESTRDTYLRSLDQLERASVRVEAQPTLDNLREYQARMHEYGKASAALDTADRHYLELALDRSRVDRERFGAYARSGGDRQKRAAFSKWAGQERELETRLVGPVPAHKNQQATEPAIPDGDRYRGDLRASDLRELADWRQGVAARARLEDRQHIIATTPSERLELAAARLARGDHSPDALRRLNAALLANVPVGRISYPILDPATKPGEHLQELSRLLRELTSSAHSIALGEPVAPEEKIKALANSVEAVRRFRKFDEHLAEGLSAVKGRRQLPEELASALRASASRLSVEGAFRITDRVTYLAIVEGARLSQAAGRWVERVMRLG